MALLERGKAVAFSLFGCQKRGVLENRDCVVFPRSRIKDGELMESGLSASILEGRRPSDETGVRWTERIITRDRDRETGNSIFPCRVS